MTDQATIFAQLMAVLEDRKAKRPRSSYTVELFDGGVDRIGAKIVEEAAEVVEAARLATNEDRQALIHEAADLIYHLFVILAHCGVPLTDVEAELARRFGISGLEEKRRRERGEVNAE